MYVNPLKDKGTFLGKTLIIWSLKDILSTDSRSSTLVDNTAIKFLNRFYKGMEKKCMY